MCVRGAYIWIFLERGSIKGTMTKKKVKNYDVRSDLRWLIITVKYRNTKRRNQIY